MKLKIVTMGNGMIFISTVRVQEWYGLIFQITSMENVRVRFDIKSVYIDGKYTEYVRFCLFGHV